MYVVSGDPGPPGVDGTDGDKGAKGEKGMEGMMGDMGIKGEMGEKGMKGQKGVMVSAAMFFHQPHDVCWPLVGTKWRNRRPRRAGTTWRQGNHR